MNKQILHDNDFYQEFSYQVVASVSLDKYEDVVRDILHVSGMKIFGTVVNSSYEQIDYTIFSDTSQAESIDTVTADDTIITSDSIIITADGSE